MMIHNKKCLVIIQARSDSRRLPRKVLAKILGKPMLWYVINRIKRMSSIEVVVATTDRKMDDEIVRIAQRLHVKYFRGKTNDVLDRFYKASLKFKADIIIRITSDCPLIDPEASTIALQKFLKGKYDYVTNDEKTDPKGLDTEIFSFIALEKSWLEAKSLQEREHVTQYIRNNPDKFRIGVVKITKNVGPQRWVVDYKDDLEFVREIYSRLYRKDRVFLLSDIVCLLKKEPNLLKINSHHKIKRKVE